MEKVTKATRESFGEALCELAKTDEDIVVLDADLSAATKTSIFQKQYPERFINCGIAESNMIGVAAGLAAAGKKPFAASFAMFSTGRAFEQIRNSVAYPNLNVKIAGSHAGISTGEDGATHQCLEDIGIMRTIPNMVILNPADHWEMMAATKAALEHNGPVYIRLGRLAIDSFNDPDNYKFELGKGITLHEGNDVTVIATGLEDSNVNNAMAGFSAKVQTPRQAVKPSYTYSGSSSAAASTGVNAGHASTQRTVSTISQTPLPGLKQPGQVTSNVKEKGINIPTFLQKTKK